MKRSRISTKTGDRAVVPPAEPPASGIYDTRIGTATAADGWITAGLRSGCRRVWVGTGGSDAANGLSYANRKLTFASALAAFKSGWTAGDQLMMAEGGSYTDPAADGIGAYSGFSAAYPTAILSYNPSAPADDTQYGRAVGSAKPVLTMTTGSSFAMEGGSGAPGRLLVQGLEIVSTSASAQIRFVYRKDYIAFQNCRFNGVGLIFDGNDSATFGYTVGAHVSKCSFWGQWNSVDGNASGIYMAYHDGAYVHDNVFGHCGWKIGVSRNDLISSGGPYVLGHGYYYHSTNINGQIHRNVFFDNAHDGFNIRGGANCSANVTIKEPVHGVVGGYSGALIPTTNVRITINDWLMVSGSHIWDNRGGNTDGIRGIGFSTQNTDTSSYINKIASFDNPIKGTANAGNNYYINDNQEWPVFPGQPDQYLTVTNWRAHNFSAQIGYHGAEPKSHTTITNSIADVLFTGSGNSVHAGTTTFPLVKTKEQFYTAMGFASEAAFFNAMLYAPHLQWAQSAISIGLPSLGITPTYATVSPPTGYGTPTAIY